MYATFTGFYIAFVTLLLLACKGDDGLEGTGLTQGTCATGDVCTASGKCLGRSYHSSQHYILDILYIKVFIRCNL